MDYIKWAEEYEKDADRISDLIKKLNAELKTARCYGKKDTIRGRIRYYERILRQMQATAQYLRSRGNDENK